MLDFKKLAEVTSIEELPEGVNVLINDNGAVKQVPANKVGEMVPDILKKAAESGDGFGYTDGNELHQIDSKYIKKEEIVPEEVSNAVETHGLGYTTEEPVPAINITWDGDTEGREVYELGGYFACKIQDEPLNKNQLIGATISSLGATEVPSVEISDNNIIYLSEDALSISGVISIFNDTEIDTVTLPKGLYFCSAGGVYVSALTKEASTKETVHQIDEKYIPSSGGGGAMMVNASFSDDGVVLDKTYEEISSALPNVNVVVSIEGSGDVSTLSQYILPHTFTLAVGDVTTLYFSVSTLHQSGAGVTYIEIKINSSNEVEATSAHLKEFTP